MRHVAAIAAGRRSSAPARAVSPTCLCESRRLCELRVSRELSVVNDNCKHEFAVVYSIAHKGITVERRRRKASGPNARGRRIAGLPAETSSGSSARHPFSNLHPLLRSRRLPCGSTCAARVRARHTQGEERGASGIEMGKPVERRGRKASGLRDHLPRQRGCHMSHARSRDAVTCADRRSLPRAPRVVAPIHTRHPRPALGRRAGQAHHGGES
jgi:hypothetical protein